MTVETTENKPENSLVQDKVDSNIVQQTEQKIALNQPHAETKPSKDLEEDPNWRAFREARKKDRAEREAAERRAAEKEAEAAALKAAMEAAFAKNSPPVANTQYNDQNYSMHEESEDERIEKKVQAAIAAREAAAERARLEREQQEYPNRLTQAYPDFNTIISPENIDYLEYHFPEVARPLKRQSDGFDKWSDIYLAIKKFVPNSASAKKEALKADINLSKPKSPSTTGLSQSGESNAFRLSEERKRANWERMQRALKGVS
jgi:hypothetical protein